MHFHCDGDEVVFLQAKFVDDFDAGQAALTAGVSHGVDEGRSRGGGEGEAEVLIVFAKGFCGDFNEGLGFGGSSHLCVRQLAVKVMVQGYGLPAVGFASGSDPA